MTDNAESDAPKKVCGNSGWMHDPRPAIEQTRFPGYDYCQECYEEALDETY